jgi:alcohol dehydrogenase class IV
VDTPSGTIGMVTTPRLLMVGGGSLAQLAEVARRVGLRRPLIVTDAFMAKCGLAERVTELLAKGGIESCVFDGTTPDPSTDVVSAALALLRMEGCDSVIGLGGGSPLDAAKAIAVLATNGGTMRDYMGYHRVPGAGLAMVAIPTTAGTGSEVTKVTVITDSSNNEKMMCLDVAFLPTAAIVDFELTFGMPMRLTADTGIDSLTHAIEAYVSRKAHPHTDTLALSAMRLISGHIRTACAEPRNATAREAMMLGAMQAGMAFSNASVCLVHGMSRPIGAMFHVPHGLSNAMLLPAVTRFSLEGATRRYADCVRAMGVALGEKDAVAAKRLVEALARLNRDLEVPSPSAYGIPRARWEEAKPVMARQALASGSPANNPRVPTEEEIRVLYDEVFESSG